ncbi:CsgG/HfaB family protein [Diaphorobacter aerolatus]|uniref:CsgG/HfaB family protein n=1 Tax=Diaphorobacter aerolatus TaxID=1288495 RepID=UPI001D02AE73|nr:CsgG/HfaB family protein [Diaphorobacter aerolatus]
MKKILMQRAALATMMAALVGCASTENALKDASTLMEERDSEKLEPVNNLSTYASSLARFGRMLDVYKDGDPIIYMQTRNISDATNLSNPLVGAEIPGDITEMVRTAVNRIGAHIVYVPYHPDYLISQAQLGAKFGVTMPDFLITGALTEFDRAIAGAGRSNSVGIQFGGGNGKTDIGADVKRTAIYSALALDLNLVSFSTQQMVPRIQASNVVKVLNLSTENNGSLGFYGNAFGFKLEGKYLQGRHSAIRTLVDLSVLELVGKATNTPYWRCIPGGKPDPVVVENMQKAYESLAPELKLGLIQVTLRKYGQPVQVTQQLDEETKAALQAVYSERYAALGPVDVMKWKGFEPLFFGVPMAWDGTLEPATKAADASVAPAPQGGRTSQKAGT